MANELFGGLNNLGGLGGILGGIAKSVMPKDTPEGKLLNAQSELSVSRKRTSCWKSARRRRILELGAASRHL